MSSDQGGHPPQDDDGQKSREPDFIARYAPVNQSGHGEPVPKTESSGPRTGSSGRLLIYGCLGIFVGGLFLILCAGFGTYSYVTKQVEQYTAVAPIEIPSVEYSEEQFVDLDTRMSDFRELIDQPDSDQEQSKAPKQFVLTSDDINALIARQEQLRGKVFVQIGDGALTGEISVPTEGLLPGGKGRFFNASGTFEVKMKNGNLYVMLVEAEVKGERIPPHFMGEIRKQNLARNFQLDPKGAEMIGKISDIQIEGDRMVVTMKEPDPVVEVPIASERISEQASEPASEPAATPDVASPLEKVLRGI